MNNRASTAHLAAWFWGLPVVLSLLWLWYRLVDALRLVWSLDPRYAYGWVVPVLCVYLAWLRWDRWRAARSLRSNAIPPGEGNVTCPTGPPREVSNAVEAGRPGVSRWGIVAGCGLALLYTVARWIQEANPWWSLAHWAMAVAVAGLTLWVLARALEVYKAYGHPPRARSRHGTSSCSPWRSLVWRCRGPTRGANR